MLLYSRVFEQARHGAREHARFGQRLDAAAGGSEAADEPAPLLGELADRADRGGLGGARAPLDGAQPVARRERYLGGAGLIGGEAAPGRPTLDLFNGRNRFGLAAPVAHQR